MLGGKLINNDAQKDGVGYFLNFEYIYFSLFNDLSLYITTVSFTDFPIWRQRTVATNLINKFTNKS